MAALVRHERPAVPTVRPVIVTAVGAGSAALAGSAPATPTLITGAISAAADRAGDLAPPR